MYALQQDYFPIVLIISTKAMLRFPLLQIFPDVPMTALSAVCAISMRQHSELFIASRRPFSGNSLPYADLEKTTA